jgi:hypothetical protein
MSAFLRSNALRIGSSVVVVLFGLGGTILIVGSTGGTAAATSAPPANHYLCYTATAPKGFTIPQGTRLIPEGSGNGFVPRFGAAQYHCNPTIKTAAGVQYPIVQPTWHSLCFKITTKQASTTAAWSNQFGTASLVTKTPNLFCVPSWKSLTGPPNQQPTTPPGSDHYTCYPVSYAKGSHHYMPPSPITVQDEFAKAPVTVKVGAPQELCVPTEKILPTGSVYDVQNPSLYYVCFKVSKTPIIKAVWDENQFGTGIVKIKKTKWLCLPSTASPVGTAVG